MIVVVANTRIKEGYQSEILKLANVVAEATRQEPGCISYRFLQDPLCHAMGAGPNSSVTILKK